MTDYSSKINNFCIYYLLFIAELDNGFLPVARHGDGFAVDDFVKNRRAGNRLIVDFFDHVVLFNARAFAEAVRFHGFNRPFAVFKIGANAD